MKSFKFTGIYISDEAANESKYMFYIPPLHRFVWMFDGHYGYYAHGENIKLYGSPEDLYDYLDAHKPLGYPSSKRCHLMELLYDASSCI